MDDRCGVVRGGCAAFGGGPMHSYQWTAGDTVLRLTPAWPFAAGYAVMALVFFTA
jgi:hypothetical protein